VRFAPGDRAFLAALLTSLPREVLRRLRLLIRPDTVLRWHRDLMRRRHARTCRPKRSGRPPTVRSIRALALRLVRENPGWGYRRVHGELATLGIKVAPSTVWEILKQAGLDPAPERASTTWADFLRSQADALLACDFIETVTLSGQRQYFGRRKSPWCSPAPGRGHGRGLGHRRRAGGLLLGVIPDVVLIPVLAAVLPLSAVKLDRHGMSSARSSAGRCAGLRTRSPVSSRIWSQSS
jgi:transposase